MELAFFHQLILGIIQGITEWLPISSSGMTIFVMTNFFGITDIGVLLHKALFLHLGTFFAALIYFRKDVADLFVALFNYKNADLKIKKILNFLILSTIITGILGILIIKLLLNVNLELTGKTITFAVGILLFVTAGIQLTSKKTGLKKEKEIKNTDSVIAGFAQGLAVLPGLSRSGITTSTLLLKKFDDTSALRLSFLMSLPVVLFGNILINIQNTTSVGINTASFFGLFIAFIFGFLTIHGLIKLSKRINFGWFALIFSLLMMISVLI